MIIFDFYSVAGFIVAILALISLKPHFGGVIMTIVAFLLMMLLWPITALVVIVHQIDKRRV
jgi:hypothetical protein